MQLEVDQIMATVQNLMSQVPPWVVNGFALFGALCTFLMFIRFFAWLLVPSRPVCNCPVESLVNMNRQGMGHMASMQTQLMSALTTFQTKSLEAIQEIAISDEGDD